jgi:hypothetical protein
MTTKITKDQARELRRRHIPERISYINCCRDAGLLTDGEADRQIDRELGWIHRLRPYCIKKR